MDRVTVELLLPVISTLVGGIFTGLVWMARLLYHMKRDIDFAHCKLRSLEKQLNMETKP